jgi:Tol biopolymer transport system component
MSGLHEAFDEIVADVPVYGDLDRAIEQAEHDRRRRHGVVAGLAAAAVVLAVIIGLLAATGDANDPQRPTGPLNSPSPTPIPVATDGSIYFAAEASAGKALTDFRSFGEVETDPKQMDIYLSRTGQPVRRIIGTSAHERCPAVSPDGARLAYLEGTTIVIVRLDANGDPGSPEVRVDLKAQDLYAPDIYRPRNHAGATCPQWAPDGRRLGYQVTLGDPNTTISGSLTAEVHAVSLDGKDRVLTSFDTPPWQVEPDFAWSPDGDELAYTTVEGVWRAPLDGGAPELLWRSPQGDSTQMMPMDYDRPISLAWSSRDELAFSVRGFVPTEPDNPLSGGNEKYTLVVADADSGRVRLEAPAGSPLEGGAGEAWSPDGSLLVFTGPDGGILLHDRGTGTTEPARLQLAENQAVRLEAPAWSPDGQKLLARARDDAKGFALVSFAANGSSSEVRTPWTWSLDWASLDDVDWSRR